MRLIDADEAYKILTDYYHQRTEIQHKALKEAIERVPTIEAEPTEEQVKEYCRKRCLVVVTGELFDKMKTMWTVKHGRWLWVDGVRCSICNHKLQTTGLPSYCPHCGAKMDEEEVQI